MNASKIKRVPEGRNETEEFEGVVVVLRGGLDVVVAEGLLLDTKMTGLNEAAL